MRGQLNEAPFADKMEYLDYGECVEIGKLNNHQRVKNKYIYIKRILDIVASICGLVILIPLFICVAIFIKFEDGGSVIFTQTRCGKNNKHFKMYKFRSMCKDAEAKLADLENDNERDGPMFKMSNDPRVTKVGSFIRKTCIDELPQLINVLQGHMSMVGPRPPLPNEVAQYSSHDMKRLDVTPGLTCYWQVRKGEKPTFDEGVAMDLEYINKQSLFTDFKLILLTIKVVVFRRGDN